MLLRNTREKNFFSKFIYRHISSLFFLSLLRKHSVCLYISVRVCVCVCELHQPLTRLRVSSPIGLHSWPWPWKKTERQGKRERERERLQAFCCCSIEGAFVQNMQTKRIWEFVWKFSVRGLFFFSFPHFVSFYVSTYVCWNDFGSRHTR